LAVAKIGDANIEYYVEGAGPPLLMIMGFAGMASAWGEPFLSLLRERFTTIRLSNRGAGLSDMPTDTPVTVRLMADDAAGLLEELGIRSAHVFGVSMGGMIAQELALNHPQRVRGAVLGCTNCGQPHSVMAQPEVIARMSQLTSLVSQPTPELVNEFWRVAVTPEFVESRPDFLAAIAAEGMKTPPSLPALARQFAAIKGFSTHDRLPEMAAPTLVVHGDRDVLVPPGNAEILHQRIPGSRLRIIEGAGHMFVWEKPEESTAAIAEFLSSVAVAA
jgi:pimeloyl-ACP methyl ester carboxylesterase